MAEDQQVVKIDGEQFSLVEIPASGTELVQVEKKRLLGAVDLPALVEDLGRVGNFVRIAYNGVAGYTDLQISIREIGYDVTRLCDKSAVTVTKFKQASGSILDDLQSTYQFLLSGFEEVALATLESVTEVAKDMVEAADELHKEFDEESKRVEEALKDTMKTKGSETDRKKELMEKEKQFETDKVRAVEMKKNAVEDFQLYEEKYKAAEAKQDAYESSASNPLKRLANGVLSPFTGGRKVFDTDGDLRRAQEVREEKLKHLEEMRAQRTVRSKAIQDIAEFTKRIENCKDDSQLADVAIDALHQAMGGLQTLSVTMLNTALFWKQMQVHCEQLAKEKMKKSISIVMKMPREERLRFWTEDGFKIQAIKYYGKWVALDDVCSIYMGKIQETQKDLHRYLQENPTLTEARQNVRQLAVTFRQDLEKAQKAIEEKEHAAQEEEQELGSS